MSKFEKQVLADSSGAVLFAARTMYLEAKSGAEGSEAHKITPAVADTAHAVKAVAIVSVAARSIARMAFLTDVAEAGGIKGVVARGELILTRALEGGYMKNINSRETVDMLRASHDLSDF